MANQDPSGSPGFGLITEESPVINNFILTFASRAPGGAVFPNDPGIRGDAFAGGSSGFLPTSIRQAASAPGSASVSLLAAGLVGLGVFRRNWAA